MDNSILYQISHSGLCWVILLTAFYCYQQLFSFWFNPNKQYDPNRDITAALISALPLLGLLGTIMGLLKSFVALQSGLTGTEIFSQGIGDALLTTQLGLICAVPAWVIRGMMTSHHAKQDNRAAGHA